MDTADRLKELEDEFQATKEELKDILFEMRTYVMEAESPIPNDLDRDKLHEELNVEKKRKELNTEKGVEAHGNR